MQAEDWRVWAELGDLGYRVIVIRYDRDPEEQVAGYADVFGALWHRTGMVVPSVYTGGL